jgi:hypothetical protein
LGASKSKGLLNRITKKKRMLAGALDNTIGKQFPQEKTILRE